MSAALAPREVIAGKYQVDCVLAEGGMGVVLAATDMQLDRQVAIKVLSEAQVRSVEAAARFLQEARAAARLTSDHVVKVFDVGTLPSGAPYMVMELLRGADLATVVESEGTLAIADAVGFIVQACEAVAEAHVEGIVHRDLKPANLFLSRQLDGTSRIKVLDFGISKLTDRGEGSAVSLTHTSWMLGSPVYMSPEQLRSARDVDCRSDIWALGTILFELVAGRPPFTGESVAELSAKILMDAVPSPSRIRGSPLPTGLETVILKALTKDAAQRYSGAAELASALSPFAPPRCRPNIERIRGLLKLKAASDAASTIRPTQEAPRFVHPVDPEPETRASWGNTTVHTPPLQPYRRLGVTIAGALAAGGLLGVAAMLWEPERLPATMNEDPTTSDSHAIRRAPEIPIRTVLEPIPAPRYTPAPGEQDGGEPRFVQRTWRAPKAAKRPRPGEADRRKGADDSKPPLRLDFGGRK